MKNLIAALFCLSTYQLCSGQVNLVMPTGDDSRILNNFIVMLQPGEQIEPVVAQYPSLQISRCLSPRMNIWLLQRNTTEGAEKFLLQLRADKRIKMVQFDHRIEERSVIPNDSYFAQQWNMLNTGQSNGTVGADIDATEAWSINQTNITSTGDTLVVAIIDGKFDLTHEDINYFTNYYEVPANGIDDDGNGYIDDVNGWNARDTSGNIHSTGSDAGHSTHLAGIVGAKGNNGKGVAGVCWGVKILPVRYGLAQESFVVASYDYVREMRILYNNTFGSKGAFVVATNSSFGINGGPGGARHTDFPIWCAMYDSMGVIGILSAGATANTSWDVDAQDDMPTGCPSDFLISVTNTDRNDRRNGAGYGKVNIDLGAPGTGVYSSIPGNLYSAMTGTSMATPHVAGGIAAMYAAACKRFVEDYFAKPDTIAMLVKKYILDGAEWVTSLNNMTVTGSRFNLFRSIENLKRYNCNDCAFDIDLQKYPITCKSAADGVLSVTAPGNLTDYTFLWSNGSNTAVCQHLSPGFYEVTVTDTASGCSRIYTAELHDPDSIRVIALTLIPPDSLNPGNISISAAAANDTLLYSLDGVNYQTTAIFSVPNPGNYTVYIKNPSGCVVQRQVLLSDVRNIPATDLGLSVYPNPANDVLRVAFNLPKPTELTFRIHNMIGQAVYAEERNYPAGIFDEPLNIAALPAGVYYVTLTATQYGTTSATRIFIITR